MSEATTPARLRDLAEWSEIDGRRKVAAALRAAAEEIDVLNSALRGAVSEIDAQRHNVVRERDLGEEYMRDAADLTATLAAREALLVRASDALDTAKFIFGTGDMERARALAAEIAAALGQEADHDA